MYVTTVVFLQESGRVVVPSWCRRGMSRTAGTRRAPSSSPSSGCRSRDGLSGLSGRRQGDDFTKKLMEKWVVQKYGTKKLMVWSLMVPPKKPLKFWTQLQNLRHSHIRKNNLVFLFPSCLGYYRNIWKIIGRHTYVYIYIYTYTCIYHIILNYIEQKRTLWMGIEQLFCRISWGYNEDMDEKPHSMILL